MKEASVWPCHRSLYITGCQIYYWPREIMSGVGIYIWPGNILWAMDYILRHGIYFSTWNIFLAMEYMLTAEAFLVGCSIYFVGRSKNCWHSTSYIRNTTSELACCIHGHSRPRWWWWRSYRNDLPPCDTVSVSVWNSWLQSGTRSVVPTLPQFPW